MTSYIHFYWGDSNFIADFLSDGVERIKISGKII